MTARLEFTSKALGGKGQFPQFGGGTGPASVLCLQLVDGCYGLMVALQCGIKFNVGAAKGGELCLNFSEIVFGDGQMPVGFGQALGGDQSVGRTTECGTKFFDNGI